MRRIGVGLLLAANALLLYTTLAAPAYARAHSYLDPALLAEYARPWPLALASAFVVAGIALALVPIRRGERWALWPSLVMWTILFLTRVATDPRCLVVLDPHQHGCHTFMIAVVLALAGLAFSR